MTIQLKILGKIDVLADGHCVPLCGVKPKQLLAALLLHANTLVPTERLIDALWPDDPPQSALDNLRTYATAIRRSMRSTTDSRILLTTSRAGYLLAVPAEALDLSRFRELTALSQEALGAGDLAGTAGNLNQALSLWTGAAGEGLPRVGWLGSALESLDELRTIALEERADTWLRLGRHAELTPELLRLVAEHPLRERFWHQLMLAQYRSGAAGKALKSYAAARRILADELGIEPGPELVELHRAVLRRQVPPVPENGDVGSAGMATPTEGPRGGPCQSDAEPAGQRLPKTPTQPAPSAGRYVPLQVPAPPVPFVGRQDEAVLLQEALGSTASGPPATAVISGPIGIGKSALAVAVAHKLRGRFPDGQLYVDLREFGQPRSHSMILAVLDHLLVSLGRSASREATLPESVSLLRSTLAERRILLVIDNAVCAMPVAALLPAYPGSSAIITSSRGLSVPQMTHHTRLGALSDAEGLLLLESLVGAEPVHREPEAALEMVQLSQGNPLTLRAVGARLMNRSSWSISMLRDRLRHEQVRLDELRLGESSIRQHLRTVLDELAAERPSAVTLLTRLSQFPGSFRRSDLTDLMWVKGRPELGRSHYLSDLETLIDFHLVEAPSPEQFNLPELVRLFAAELA
ncbi:BTAD domain-containing putative transcriptional regulator [Micromonospora carbonacea]|uniref:AfsR/SARP family transcriptional regulator n=1 Tax=Micromonospora carbonacea TaxID=47853 RepID=UPI003D7481FB